MVKSAYVKQTYNLNQTLSNFIIAEKKNLPAMLHHNSAPGHICGYSEASGLHKFGGSLQSLISAFVTVTVSGYLVTHLISLMSLSRQIDS